VTELRAYRRPVSIWWWVRKRSYFLFVMRELSSIFVAWSVLFLVVMIGAVARGASAYQHFIDFAAHPVVVALNAVALAFIALHTVTWFSLTPQALVVQVRGTRVPGWVIIASQYIGLVVVTGFVSWLVTR